MCPREERGRLRKAAAAPARRAALRAILLGALLASPAWGGEPEASRPAPAPGAPAILTSPADAAQIWAQWGLVFQSLRLSAAGHMIDFRYRVVDEQKAAPLFVRGTKARLIDQRSGRALAVPNLGKVGPLRTTGAPKAGKIYWMFFANNGGFVQGGSQVTIEIGELRVENLTVEAPKPAAGPSPTAAGATSTRTP